MVSDWRCVICNNQAEENVAHFPMGCGEFEKDRLVQLDDLSRILGTR